MSIQGTADLKKKKKLSHYFIFLLKTHSAEKYVLLVTRKEHIYLDVFIQETQALGKHCTDNRVALSLAGNNWATPLKLVCTA